MLNAHSSAALLGAPCSHEHSSAALFEVLRLRAPSFAALLGEPCSHAHTASAAMWGIAGSSPRFVFSLWSMFSAMLKASRGWLREQLVRRSERNIRTPARLAEEALPIASADDSSDDASLYGRIVELPGPIL